MKKKTSKKELGTGAVFLFYFLVILGEEILLRIFTEDIFVNIGLLYIPLFSLCGALLFTFFTCIFRGTARKVIISLLLFIIALFYAAQTVCEYLMRMYFSPYSLINGGQVTSFMREIIIAVSECKWMILAHLVPVIILIIIICAKLTFRKTTFGKLMLVLLMAVLIGGGAVGSTFISPEGALSPNSLIFRTDNFKAGVSKLGLGTTFVISGQRLVFGFDPMPPSFDDDSSSGNAGPAADSKTEKAKLRSQERFNVLDIDFKSISEKTDDAVVRKMNDYFNEAEPTKKNDKTGLFKGKNLIVLTAESFCSYAVDRELTPTLYKMQHEGFDFTNFYNPLWDVSTSDGEYVNNMSLIPKSGVWSLNQSAENWLPLTLGHQLGKAGYTTKAYHDYYADYYKRTETHPNMGYTFKGIGTGLDMDPAWPPSDLEMIKLTTPDYVKDKKFHVYYMTVSGHMAYNFKDNRMAAKNREFVEDLDLPEEAKAYLACNIELDRAMEQLLKDLKKAGRLDDTVIVLSGDHFPYGMKQSSIDALTRHKTDEEFEIYKSTLILYNSKMKPEKVDKYCSSMDILPTLSNLFGLEYDSRLLMGRDIFSDSDPLVIFNSRNWITDKARYIALQDKVMLNEEAGPEKGSGKAAGQSGTAESSGSTGSALNVSRDYVDKINKRVADEFNISRLVLDKDYYRIILPEEN